MTTPAELDKLTSDLEHLDRSLLIHMIWHMRDEYTRLQRLCKVLREMLYCVYHDEFSRTTAEVDAMIQIELDGTSKHPGVPNEPSN